MGILRVDDELHLTPRAALEEGPKLANPATVAGFGASSHEVGER
jgi:hypothetical protein